MVSPFVSIEEVKRMWGVRTKQIVIRLTGTQSDGKWITVAAALRTIKMRYGVVSNAGAMGVDIQQKDVILVPTGSFEHDGDRGAEVYVPEDMLRYWDLEHRV